MIQDDIHRTPRLQVIRFHVRLVIIPILTLRGHTGAISTHSSSVILNGFRVLNASGEIISFHLRKISIYPFRLRKHAEPTKKKKTSKSGCLRPFNRRNRKQRRRKRTLFTAVIIYSMGPAWWRDQRHCLPPFAKNRSRLKTECKNYWHR